MPQAVHEPAQHVAKHVAKHAGPRAAQHREPRATPASRVDVAFTYVVCCVDGSLYIGFARDVDDRVATHNAGRGARYTRARLPVRLVWRWQASTERARRLEGLLKNLDRARRVRLVDGDVRVLLPVLAEVSARVRARRP
jgi:putative endonuclease